MWGGVLAPGDCDGICNDFAEVAFLAEHAGEVAVDAVLPADTDSTVVAGMSYEEQCQNDGESQESVGLSPTDKDMSYDEPKAIVVGAVGTGAPWSLLHDRAGFDNYGKLWCVGRPYLG